MKSRKPSGNASRRIPRMPQRKADERRDRRHEREPLQRHLSGRRAERIEREREHEADAARGVWRSLGPSARRRGCAVSDRHDGHEEAVLVVLRRRPALGECADRGREDGRHPDPERDLVAAGPLHGPRFARIRPGKAASARCALCGRAIHSRHETRDLRSEPDRSRRAQRAAALRAAELRADLPGLRDLGLRTGFGPARCSSRSGCCGSVGAELIRSTSARKPGCPSSPTVSPSLRSSPPPRDRTSSSCTAGSLRSPRRRGPIWASTSPTALRNATASDAASSLTRPSSASWCRSWASCERFRKLAR